MTNQPFTLGPDEGEVFDAGPFHIVARVVGSQSGGLFEVHDLTMGPATVDYHVHNRMDETLIVVEGEVEFLIAGKSYVRGPGSVAYAPRGVHHGFTNRGPGQARVLAMFTPAGSQDAYFRALVPLFQNGAPDMDELKRLQKEYDQELVPQP